MAIGDVAKQAKLSKEQIEAFYHNDFVDGQVEHFRDLIGPNGDSLVVDIGGGRGYFAGRLNVLGGYRTRVIEMDPASVESCQAMGIEAHLGDALRPDILGDEQVVTFNLILHHLVAKSEAETRELQLTALRAWHQAGVRIFVHEYIYQSLVGRISPRIIYKITSSGLLSNVGRFIAQFVPSLQANTFGVGVRFRPHEEWLEMFAEAGYQVIGTRIGAPEAITISRRFLLIKAIRRDSFVLKAWAGGQEHGRSFGVKLAAREAESQV